jgi:hypothetical protein
MCVDAKDTRDSRDLIAGAKAHFSFDAREAEFAPISWLTPRTPGWHNAATTRLKRRYFSPLPAQVDGFILRWWRDATALPSARSI